MLQKQGFHDKTGEKKEWSVGASVSVGELSWQHQDVKIAVLDSKFPGPD
jgi:hypothetical protein